MPPNISNGKSAEICAENNNQFRRDEVLYNGYFYDVTNFINKHPGGNVIRFYTEHGEDATQAIEQFHYRSMSRVESLLKSFKRRPATANERGLSPKTLSRHEALTADYRKLFQEFKDEGYFEPCIRHVILRLIEVFALITLSTGIFLQQETFLGRFITIIFVGFSFSRTGWIQHEGGHNSLTGRPTLDKWLQNLSLGFFAGGSSVWWNSQHNRHHAMPQRLQHDVDLSTLPYVAFHKKAVKSKSEIYSFFIKFQGIFYWTLDLFVVIIAWRLVLHPRYSIRKGAYHELLLGMPTLLFGWFCTGIHWYILIAYWYAFFMAMNFALNHSHLEVAEQPTHWIEYSLTHTANVESNMLVDYFMGYLNYQIEHHLFPTMPQFRQKDICHRVKAVAEKHGLAYRVFTYPEAIRLMVKNLHDVGKELTTDGYFEKDEAKNE